MCPWAVNSQSLGMKREIGKSASPSAVKGQKQVMSVLIAKLFTFQSTVLDVFIHWNSIRAQCFTWLRIWYVWVMSLSIQLQSIKKPSKMWLTTRTSLPTNPTPNQHCDSFSLLLPPPPPIDSVLREAYASSSTENRKAHSCAACLPLVLSSLPHSWPPGSPVLSCALGDCGQRGTLPRVMGTQNGCLQRMWPEVPEGLTE